MALKLSIAVTLVSLALTVGTSLRIHQIEEEEQATILAQEITRLRAELIDRLQAQAHFLRGIRAFFAATPDAGDTHWQRYAAELQGGQHFSEIVSFGYARRLPRGDSDPFVIQHAVHGSPGDPGATAIDLAAEARGRRALEAARDLDQAVLSGRLPLRAESRPQAEPGLLLVMPVYRALPELPSVQLRRTAISGAAYVSFPVDRLIRSLHSLQQSRLGVRIFDDEGFNNGEGGQGLTLLFDSLGQNLVYGPLEERQIEFGNRKWILEFQPIAPPSVWRESNILFAAGLAISLLLGALTWNLSTRRQQAESLAGEMNAELRRSEERFQLAAQATNDGLWERDFVTNELYVSAQLEKVLRFAPGTLPRSHEFVLSRIHPDDLPGLREAGIRHLRDGEPYEVEYRALRGDNQWAWFRSHGQAVRDETGRALRMVGSISDIDRRKQAEIRLERYKDFLSTVLRSIPHPVFVKNHRGYLIMVNHAMCEFANSSEEELIGAVRLNTVPVSRETGEGIRAMDRRIFATGKAESLEYELPVRGRGLRTVFASKALATDPEGDPILVCTLTDVTERRQAERAILSTGRQMQALLDAATEVSIISTDPQGVIRVFNRGAEKMLGYEGRGMVGQSPTLLHLDSEIEQRCAELSSELGRPVQGFEAFVAIPKLAGAESREWTYRRLDGSLISVSLVVTTIYDESGEISGFLGIAVDITDRRRAELELLHHRDRLYETVAERTADLERAKDLAEKASLAKTDFLANMSHELRTPMHAVLGFASIGENNALAAGEEKLRHYFHRIRQSGDRLLLLLNDLLDLSKLEVGKMRIEPQLIDVVPLVREATGEFETLMTPRHLTVSIEATGPMLALCDAARFRQVLCNLFSNAIKFSPEKGCISVRFASAAVAAGRRSQDAYTVPGLRIEVADEGPGIPPGELESIFDKFVQSSRTKSGAGGTGLGLAICREIMQAHRGSIAACNNSGGGACFILHLPATYNVLPPAPTLTRA